MKVRKEIIRPGTYFYHHPVTNKPEKMTVTADTVKYLADQGNAMLAAGLSIPVPVEHQADAKPMTESERAANRLRNNSGWVDGYEVAADNRLFGLLDIQDADIAKKLPHTIRFTSPYVNSFTDGTGKKWDGVISHLALTTRPRIVNQEPFAIDMAAALSLVSRLSDRPFTSESVGIGIPLSLAGLLRKEGIKLKPEFPAAFSLMSGIRLSKEDVEEIVDDDGGDEKERIVDDDSGDVRESPLDAVAGVETGIKDVTIHETIGHLLKALGFSPPDGMDETTFERDLYETLMAKVQELGAKATQPPPEPLPDQEDQIDTGDSPVIQESPSMYASLEEINRIADPKEKKMAKAMFSLQQENTKIKKRSEAAALSILGTAKVVRDQRIERISKRLSVSKRDKLLKMLAAPSAQLSLSDAGSVVDPMADALELLESAALDIPGLLRETKTNAFEQPHPADSTMTAERCNAVVDEVLKNTGGMPVHTR